MHKYGKIIQYNNAKRKYARFENETTIYNRDYVILD